MDHRFLSGDGGVISSTTLPRDEIDVKLKSLGVSDGFAMHFDFGGANSAYVTASTAAVGGGGGGGGGGRGQLGLPPPLPSMPPPPLPAVERYFHVAPDGSRKPYSPDDCRAIAVARSQGRSAVRVGDVILPNGRGVLQFEVRFGANALSQRWTEESWMKQGACLVEHRMIQVNLGSENTRLVVVAAATAAAAGDNSGQQQSVAAAPAPAADDDFDF
jgi:hypothetical protein